jgi:D-beta-D-heptose 7-phosphate kinase / D-beta-D-heptose 1-phosphate adenosyltransferase
VSGRLHLIPSLDRVSSAIVACTGDIMLDRFVYGDVRRISPEAPIPVLGVQSQKSVLGGLGNVARNLGALGCGIRLFSVTGDDAAGAEIEALLKNVARCQAVLLKESARETPVKVRYIAHSQQLLRADHETTDGASEEVFAALLGRFKEQVNECSLVFLSDYAKGVLKGSHARSMIAAARAADKPVVVDPKGSDFERYAGATLIKPNLKELGEATGMATASVEAQEKAARLLIERTGAEFLLVTRGSAGMLLVPKVGHWREFPSLAREVYDVSGAGDTVAAVLAAALGSGAGIVEAVELANIAAGIVVGKVGTAVADRSEIADAIERDPMAASGKILPLASAVERVRSWQHIGRRVGFMVGEFAPLTAEHLQQLEAARSSCDRLVVALKNPDAESQARALLLASLVTVDAVVICDAQTADDVHATLKPDVCMELPETDQTKHGDKARGASQKSALFRSSSRSQ